MSKDIYRPFPVPKVLLPYVRRFMLADCDAPIDIRVPARPTGYNYFGWVFRGTKAAAVDGVPMYNSNQSSLHISGQIQKAEVIVDYTGNVGHFLAEMTPLGLYEIFGISGDSCREMALDPRILEPKLTQELDRLEFSKNPTTDQVVSSVIGYLVDRSHSPRPVPEYLRSAVDFIEADPGKVTVQAVCEQLKISQRQFTREFTRLVGVPPKSFSKALQINLSVQAMMEQDHESLANIALEAGFSDQSHFTKVFGEVVLRSPRAFLDSDETMLFRFLAGRKG